MLVIILLFVITINVPLISSETLTCYCGGTRKNPFCSEHSDVCVTNGTCYKYIENLEDVGIDISYGCFSEEESKQPFRCWSSSTNAKLRLFCCNSGMMCNRYDAPETLHTFMPPRTQPQMAFPVLLVAIAVFVVAVAIIMAVVILKCVKKRSWSPTKFYPYPISADYNDPTLTIGSGSGAGNPLLIERTIARQIELKEVIGHGRFGEVYRGIYSGSNVAVKKFSNRDEPSWDREKEIFDTCMLRHSNILGFIAADNKDEGMYMELWIISEYHKNGSLYDFLDKNKVCKKTLLLMTTSIANGLAHLHIEIPAGSQAKPPIAHRDLKSKNILVKDNMECAIADFGHAVRYFSKTNEIKGGSDDFLAGTKRYMAPEVLNGTLNRNVFESFSRADIYSVALVFWEIARRSDINGQDRDYQLPYFDLVPADPSPEIMKKVVCDEGKRPRFYSEWSMDPTLASLAKIISECWQEKDRARLSALRIKKNLVELQSNNNKSTDPNFSNIMVA